MRRAINIAIILSIAAPAFAGAGAEVRRDFQKTVALASGRAFQIDHSLGSIAIRTHSRAEADIRASIQCSADTDTEARAVCDGIQISVQETSSGVMVRTDYPSEQRRGRRNIGFSVKYDITVPENAPLDVRNRFGNVTVTDSHAAGSIQNNNGNVVFTGGRGRQQIQNSFGNVEVRTNNGDLTVRNGNGRVTANDITGSVEVSNRFDTIRLTNVSGGVTINSNNGTIEAQTIGGPASIVNSFGSVTLTDIKANVTVKNQNGAVRVTDVTGAADLGTSFDRVTFSRIGKTVKVFANNANVVGDTVGESAWVETSFGNVDVRAVKGGAKVTANNTSITLNDIGGEVDAKTTFNGVTVNGAAGPITVEGQNGSVVVEARPGRCQPISLTTSFGPIRLTVPRGVGYNINARTSFGHVVLLPADGSRPELISRGDSGISGNPEALSARVSGGGCEIRLIGRNGNIDILTK